LRELKNHLKETRVKKYIVELTVEQREELSHMISTGKASARELTHARLLLKTDVITLPRCEMTERESRNTCD